VGLRRLRLLDPPYLETTMTPHDLKDRVAQVIAEEIGPALDLDAGAIEVVGVDGGVVQVRLGAACVGCPSSIMTIVMGLEQELRQRIPEVEYLEAVP
jgi:Fe-S cluster biogenesis protein NfuA